MVETPHGVDLSFLSFTVETVWQGVVSPGQRAQTYGRQGQAGPPVCLARPYCLPYECCSTSRTTAPYTASPCTKATNLADVHQVQDALACAEEFQHMCA